MCVWPLWRLEILCWFCCAPNEKKIIIVFQQLIYKLYVCFASLTLYKNSQYYFFFLSAAAAFFWENSESFIQFFFHALFLYTDRKIYFLTPPTREYHTKNPPEKKRTVCTVLFYSQGREYIYIYSTTVF